MASAISLVDVGRKYRRYGRARPRTLKEAVLGGFRGTRGERFWALRDVSLEIEAASTLGVIGPNGAGKSTLLRLLARIERPDEGAIEVRGKVGALLALGVGFNPDLTGRENAILAGVVAGLSRQEVRRRLDDIIAFAELKDFIDSPLRIYSSGMKARLGFALATHIDPEVLLIDEVLSVGDLAFQRKCLDRLRRFQAAGVTIVIVTHDINMVNELCDTAVALRGGRVTAVGEARGVVSGYLASSLDETRKLTPADVPDTVTPGGRPLRVRENRFGSQEAAVSAVRILDQWGAPGAEVSVGGRLAVSITLSAPPHLKDVAVGVTMWRSDGVMCLNTGTTRTRSESGESGTEALLLEIERLDLAPGDYTFDVGLYSGDWSRCFDYHAQAYPLKVVGEPSDFGVIAPPLSWTTGPETAARRTSHGNTSR